MVPCTPYQLSKGHLNYLVGTTKINTLILISIRAGTNVDYVVSGGLHYSGENEVHSVNVRTIK